MIHWTNEMGTLRLAVFAFLNGHPLSQDDIDALRAYLWQWMGAPEWDALAHLRVSIRTIEDRGDLREWYARAREVGIDPF